MLQSSFFRWLGSPRVQSMISLTLLKWKKEFKTKLLGSLCQELNRIIARYTYNVFQLVRDGIFLVETGWALSLSANIGFVLQAGGWLRHAEGRTPSGARPHVAPHPLTLGRDRNGPFPWLQPKPHCLSAVLININQMWRNRPNIYCGKGDYWHSCNVTRVHRMRLRVHVCAGN